MAKTYDIISIDCPKVAMILAALNPNFRGVPYSKLHEKYAVLNYPTTNEIRVMTTSELATFTSLESGIKIKTLRSLAK